MVGVRVEIRRYVRDDFSGWVECALTDAHGRDWAFVEKGPIVAAECLGGDSPYPLPGVVACEVVARRVGPDGRAVLVIDTERPWHVEATTGETIFEVRPEQVVGFESGAAVVG